MKVHKIDGLRRTALYGIMAVIGFWTAFHATAANADSASLARFISLPARDAAHAGFWQTMDFYRFESEMKSVDFFRLQSDPYYNQQEKRIIACLKLIIEGDATAASQLLKQLHDDTTLRPYTKIVNILDRNLYSQNEQKYFQEIKSRRKFIFNQPQTTLQLYDTETLIIDVIIDGTTVPMIIDTGSPYSCLSQKTIKQLNLQLKSLHLENKNNTIKYAEKVELGKLTIKSQPFSIHTGDLDIIGWDILRELHLKINRKDQELIILNPVKNIAPRIRNLIDFGDRALVRVDLEKQGEYIYFMLDTGADTSFLQLSFFRRVDFLPEKIPLKYRYRETFYGPEDGSHKIFPAVNAYICGMPVQWKNIPIYPTIASRGLKFYGMLGLDLTHDKYGIMEIDATNGRFHLSGPDIYLFNHYENAQYHELLSDNVNPITRYPAMSGEIIMTFPALPLAIMAAPLGQKTLLNTFKYTVNSGELAFGGIPWLLTNWFYTETYPLKQKQHELDQAVLTICKLNNIQEFPTIENEALLHSGNNWLNGYILLGTGKYKEAINALANDKSERIYTVIAELKSGKPDAAAKRSQRILTDRGDFETKFTTIWLQVLSGIAKEEQLIAALEKSNQDDLAFNYYLMAEYYLNVKKDQTEAMKYCQKSMDYPFEFPSYYLAQKMRSFLLHIPHQ